MSQLVSFYETAPVTDKRGLLTDVIQRPMQVRSGYDVIEGEVVPRVVYVQAPIEGRPLLVPFGQYDAWSLRQRFEEALRVMNTLGACEIECATYSARRNAVAARVGVGPMAGWGKVTRTQSTDFDYSFSGTGAAPRDPGPIRWSNIPGLDAAKQSVLLNGGRRVEITIESESEFAADSDLARRLKSSGLVLGLEGRTQAKTLLRIKAEFPAV